MYMPSRHLYIYIYIYTYIHIHICVYTYTDIDVYICVSMCVYIHVCIYIWIYGHMFVELLSEGHPALCDRAAAAQLLGCRQIRRMVSLAACGCFY